MENFLKDNALFIENAVLIEEMYQLYLKQPTAVDSSWQKFFSQFSENNASLVKTTTKIVDDTAAQKLSVHPIIDTKQTDLLKPGQATAFSSIIHLMHLRYCKIGHLLARLDPLGLEIIPNKSEVKLNPINFGLIDTDLDRSTSWKFDKNSDKNLTVKELINCLDQIYCSSIGLECDHLLNFEEYEWITHELEDQVMNHKISVEEKKNALTSLLKSELFEQFLHTKFPGTKRFSVEGAESSILALNKIIDLSANLGAKIITIGMAHRGRLNTLVNVMNKPYREIFSEFLGTPSLAQELNVTGDVKYHMGYSSEKLLDDGKTVYLSLTPNPSHLEAVNAVVMGQVRAKQDLNKVESKSVDYKSSNLAILLHGDAAFCGQGVVAENLIMSGIDAYNVSGVIHVIINNQVGFTANPIDLHTERYPTGFAKIISAPILHVNGDDIEAVLRIIKLAVNYRFKFNKDIIIDIVCYRKYGHNEGDEPMYTQVNMYKAIHQKDTTPTVYSNKLIKDKFIDSKSVENIRQQFKELLNQELEYAKTFKPTTKEFSDRWEGYKRSNGIINKNPITGVEKRILQELGIKLCDIPNNFMLHPKLKTLFDNRRVTLEKDQPIDWAIAEQLAFATLLTENIPVRLTGQDSARGTFSHRHSVLYDQTNGNPYIPLNNLTKSQARYFVADSNLSEYSVLGFEFGYSLVNPKHLVIWEAQYGDFSNGAQIVFDQYISSSETKWLRLSGLVTLLPHAYEGQGPEHSSARLERFLQLCAENNMQVVYPTTPASIFHLLRKQVLSHFRTPLIIMSPKSLLRHKLAVSRLDEISEDTKFIPILEESFDKMGMDKIEKIICCSGKIYYDLFEARAQSGITNTTIVRFEQLYPFNKELIDNILKKYKNLKEFIWCQEEPKNMGSWNFIKDDLNDILIKNKINNQFKYIGRKPHSAPATGYSYIHNKEQQEILNEALNLKIKNKNE